MGAEIGQKVTLTDGSRCTREEVLGRVSIHEPNIVWCQELHSGTAETLDIFTEAIRRRSADFDRFVLVVDLTDAGHPDASYRADIVKWMKQQSSIHNCFIQPGGIVLRVALRFMLGRAEIPMTIHASMEEAIACARKQLKQPVSSIQAG